MPVAPTGVEALPMLHLARLLAESGTFQSWVGAANSSQALLRIHYVGFDDPGDRPLPYAVIYPAEEEGWHEEKVAGGAGDVFQDGGRLVMWLLGNTNSELSNDDNYMTFLNMTGAIRAEMKALSGSDDWMSHIRIAREVGPSFSAKNDRPDLAEEIESIYVIDY